MTTNVWYITDGEGHIFDGGHPHKKLAECAMEILFSPESHNGLVIEQLSFDKFDVVLEDGEVLNTHDTWRNADWQASIMYGGDAIVVPGHK